MPTTDQGACEWFVWDLRRSNLLDRGSLDKIVGYYLDRNPRAEPPQLAQFLIEQGVLTEFQADRLLQGKTQGFVLGPYVLMDALGTGSMGTVYRAQSRNDHQWYAVKVLPRRSMWNVRAAKRQVRLFEQFKHPALVPFVDVGTSGGMHFLAWTFVEGQSLDKLVAGAGKLPPSQAAHYVLLAAEGLEVFHNQKLFHGLIKPSNLMIGADNGLHVLDSGIGSLLAESDGESLVDTMSTANAVASGLDCASPETIADPKNMTPAGDQYSLGCVLYYCLTGQYPFPEGSAAEKMIAHQMKQPPPLATMAPGTPPGLVAVVEKLMQKSAANRYATTGALIEALRPFATQGATTPPPPNARGGRGDSVRKPASRPTQTPVRPVEPLRPRTAAAPIPEPTRQSLGRTNGRAAAPVANGMHATPNPVPPRGAPPVIPGFAEKRFDELLEEKPAIGPVTVAVCAFLLSALAWFVTWKLF